VHLAPIIATVFLLSAPAFLFDRFRRFRDLESGIHRKLLPGRTFELVFRCHGRFGKFRDLQPQLLP
jgi:hypothetical protein